jgi:methyl-accepting chemotaxis protein
MSYTLESVRIESPAYHGIVNAKDIVADILPPPLFVVEAYLHATESIVHPDMTDGNLARIEVLHKEFESRYAFWVAADIPQHIKTLISGDIRTTGTDFWKVMDEEAIPALKSGDKAAIASAFDKLRDAFEAEKRAVERLVKASIDDLTARETQAHHDAVIFTGVAFATAGVALAVLWGGLLFFKRRSITPVLLMSFYLRNLAAGEYADTIPGSGRRDEVGVMATAVAVLRDASIEKIALEEAASRQRDMTESERAANAFAQAELASDLQKVVRDLGDGLKRLADFNIRQTLDTPFKQEFEPLRRDFNASLAAFQDVLTNILDKSREIAASTQTLGNSADQLARRTEQQAAALEQSAAALEEITSNVRNATERTAVTRARTAEAKDNVNASSDVVRNAIDAMARIEDASAQISQITSVIDEIAFQTNLLALNAGVEAARAGEAGKGFAVVAQEVRELAQRSARAAREIAGLIDRSNREVEGGVDLVRRTGDALSQIEDHIRSIATDIDAIATAAQEQSTGLAEITASMGQMDQITQQNAAMVEETTAATHGLTAETGSLVELVGQFVLNRRANSSETNVDRQMTAPLRGTAA